MKEHAYIKPVVRVHASFGEAREFFEKRRDLFPFEKDKPFSISALADERRSLVLGEPGVGKTELLKRIDEHLKGKGVGVRRLSLASPSAVRDIDDFVRGGTNGRMALLLDALDEVKASDLPAMIEKIGEVSRACPNLRLFVSGRWVFVSRHANSFPEFRIATVFPFSLVQVREYLTASGHKEEDVDKLVRRIMSFGHQTLVVQIPRYLFYLDEFIEKKGFDNASKLSRNDLFEYLIHSKLELEDDKLNADKVALKKRVLEKLALTMEIYQTNVLSKDELMTFFDVLKSDVKLAALSQIGLENMYDKSLLRVSKDDMGTVEFDNTEFQEYLAAKEITRFADPSRTAFALAVDQEIGEILPSWYNALTFLVDMQPEMLEQLVEFSGLRADRFRALDEHFLNFLSRVDYRRTLPALKPRLFRDIMDYHERTLQRLPIRLASAMGSLYDGTVEGYLKTHMADAEKRADVGRSVPLANIIYAAAQLPNSPVNPDRAFWRKTFLDYARDKDEDSVLRRDALVGLTNLKDQSVLDDLGTIDDSDELFRQDLLLMCRELAPDHPRSLDFFFAATKRKDIQGRYGLYAMTSDNSFRRFLREMIADESLREMFLDQSSIFHDRDGTFAQKIARSGQEDVRALAKELLVRSINLNSRFDNQHSSFLRDLWHSLRERDSALVTDIVNILAKDHGSDSALWYACPLFAEVLDIDDVRPFVTAMLAAGDRQDAHRTMLLIKYSKRDDAKGMYEAGRPLLSDEYASQEKAQADGDGGDRERQAKETLKEFRFMLQPQPGQYIQSVFDFYNGHAAELDPWITQSDRNRLIELITGTAFAHMDPADSDLTITTEGESTSYTTTVGIGIFREALMAAKHLDLNIDNFRRQILNYIPFSYQDELEVIFDLIKDIRPGELAPVIDIYRSRSSDLWRHNPASFIRAMEQYHVTDAAPVLRSLSLASQWRPYEREQAMIAATSLAPDSTFLNSIFTLYGNSKDGEEKPLAETANGLLITSFSDRDAIVWRLAEIVKRAASYIDEPSYVGARGVSAIESELRFEKTFAKPLMSLKDPGFQTEYLDLLDSAMSVWSKGKDFQSYAGYLWEIVCSYIDNLKEKRSYGPLRALEKKINELRDREGANWLAHRVAGLRQTYISYLGRLDNVAKAIAKYNDCLEYAADKIRNESELFEHLKTALEKDIRQWIEGEGAYKLLTKKLPEKHIQMTLKAPIELALTKRGFQVEIMRESQLLDEKRTDFLVRYGFAGPVVIEVKLTSNSDIRGNNLEKSKSYESMQRYMAGYGARHGIFMIIDNAQASNLPLIVKAYQKIKGVTAMSFECRGVARKTNVARGGKTGRVRQANGPATRQRSNSKTTPKSGHRRTNNE